MFIYLFNLFFISFKGTEKLNGISIQTVQLPPQKVSVIFEDSWRKRNMPGEMGKRQRFQEKSGNYRPGSLERASSLC